MNSAWGIFVRATLIVVLIFLASPVSAQMDTSPVDPAAGDKSDENGSAPAAEPGSLNLEALKKQLETLEQLLAKVETMRESVIESREMAHKKVQETESLADLENYNKWLETEEKLDAAVLKVRGELDKLKQKIEEFQSR